jgi:hypothetical protein
MGMSTNQPARPAGHDILARYLDAYAQARQLSDMERPWGLGDDSLDLLWNKLNAALRSDPDELNQIISAELSEHDREHIVQRLAPLIFALPFREYPSEVRAIRNAKTLNFIVRHFPESEPEHKNGAEPEAGLLTYVPVRARKARRAEVEDLPMGFLPAALTQAFIGHLRQIFRIEAGKCRKDVTVSSGGRRRRIRVILLAHERGVTLRFLKRLSSPAEEN